MRDMVVASIFAVAVLVGLALSQQGCGGDDLVVGGMIPITPTVTRATPTAECLETGAPCTVSSECCSAVCRTGVLVCR